VYLLNTNRVKILELLYDNKKKYISGEKISKTLDISRTAVWKYIKNLREKGYIIKSTHGKGYKLIKKPEDLFIAEELVRKINTHNIVSNIYIFDNLDSTNNRAKKMAENGERHGSVIIAEEQINGKGRLGRSWYSPPGEGLWFSIILRPDFLPIKAPLITIISSLAIWNVLNKYEYNPLIKWPNDILINGKKIAGILSELNGEMGKINYIIVGMGINCNQKIFPDYLSNKATSLFIERGGKINRINLIRDILFYFDKYYLILENDNIHDIINEWKSHLNIINKRVELKSNNKIYRGMAVNVSDYGALILKDDKGKLHNFWAGDTTFEL